MSRAASELPNDLRNEISRAGYYPALVTQIVETAIGGETVLNYLLQSETTFAETIRRHLTVLVLTPTRLIAGHVDDVEADQDSPAQAMGTTDAIPISQIRSVGLTHIISNPAGTAHDGRTATLDGRNATHDGRSSHAPDQPTAELAELTLAVNWGAASRFEMGQATCGDPGCEGDHGYLGAITPDDLVVRVAAAAEGAEAIEKALAFARALSAATAGTSKAGVSYSGRSSEPGVSGVTASSGGTTKPRRATAQRHGSEATSR
jgi:hypothetical protein